MRWFTFCFTVVSRESLRTRTLICGRQIFTVPSVLAWGTVALIDVSFAVSTRVPWSTLAWVLVDVIKTASSVLTRITRTFVNVVWTVSTVISRHTGTCVAVYSISAVTFNVHMACGHHLLVFCLKLIVKHMQRCTKNTFSMIVIRTPLCMCVCFMSFTCKCFIYCLILKGWRLLAYFVSKGLSCFSEYEQDKIMTGWYHLQMFTEQFIFF